MHGAPLELTAWESFYVITGSSSAALIGLQFVVGALSAAIALLLIGIHNAWDSAVYIALERR